jgi:hypothetical protein
MSLTSVLSSVSECGEENEVQKGSVSTNPQLQLEVFKMLGVLGNYV